MPKPYSRRYVVVFALFNQDAYGLLHRARAKWAAKLMPAAVHAEAARLGYDTRYSGFGLGESANYDIYDRKGEMVGTSWIDTDLLGDDGKLICTDPAPAHCCH